jgi:uncharacterized RDD family membrane protein YckC
MENNSQPTSSATYTPEYGYGGFWQRFAADIVDCLIISLVFLLNLGLDISESNQSIIISLLSAFYFIFFWAYQNGQTLGKKAFGLQIVKENGQQLDLVTAIVRYLGSFISSFILSLGYLAIVFDKRKMGWHDKLAHTVVIKVDNRSNSGWLFVLIVIAILLLAVIVIAFLDNK